MISANEYKVVVPQLPVAKMYSNLLKAIAEETDNIFNIEVVPFSRLDYLIENNLVDICGPLISSKNQKKLKYDLSTASIY